MTKTHKTENDGSVKAVADVLDVVEVSPTPPLTTAFAGVVGEELAILAQQHVGADPTVNALGALFAGLLQTLDVLERRVIDLEDRAARK